LSNKKRIGYIIKIAVILLLFGAIWYKVANNHNLEDIKNLFLTTFNSNSGKAYLGIALLLMPLNWLIESRKWQILIKKLERISLFYSLQAVLAGVTVSVFTPNRIGEYAGRVLLLKHKNRIQAALSTLISSVGQMVATVVFGSISFYFYYVHYVSNQASTWIETYLIMLIIVLIITLFILFISSPTLFGLLKKIKAFRRFRKYVSFFNRYTAKELIKILFLSHLRYVVYSSQFFVLLLAFQVNIDMFTGFMLIPLTFFAMTIIPSVALAELGIREAVALTIIGISSDNDLGILGATLVLWAINLVIPSIIGSALIFRSKIFKSK
tara:strand:+ start:11447 stop:12418 length:972 start_codon:yes stop_codon:yes gene_type:complete